MLPTPINTACRTYTAAVAAYSGKTDSIPRTRMQNSTTGTAAMATMATAHPTARARPISLAIRFRIKCVNVNHQKNASPEWLH